MLDTINGLFESLGFLFILPSIVSLYRSKEVKGISYVHVSFFWAWSLWNIYYYSGLGHWFSFAGGLGILLANTVWFGMMIDYSREKRYGKEQRRGQG